MPQASILSAEERAQVVAYRDSGNTFQYIADKLGRSKTAVWNFLQEKNCKKTGRKRGTKCILSNRTGRQIQKWIGTGRVSVAQVKAMLKIEASRWTVWRAARKAQHLMWRKMRTAPIMTKYHKKKRLEWSFDQVMFTPFEWRSVIFSDEKKFNLDGPDGNAYYWHDLRTDERIFSKRKHGGGSVMVWACFSFYGRSPIAFLDGRQDSNCYVSLMEDYMLPMAHTCHEADWIYQQDNAPIHTSRTSLKWFTQNGVHLLPWPANSPDLNPIENLWAILSRRVYANHKCYSTVGELKEAIQLMWHEIDLKCLQMLVGGMHRRCTGVVQAIGGPLKY